MEIIEKIREFVERECKKPSNKYGYAPYVDHFIPVVKYAKELAEKLNADTEIVELAGWLHDIGSIIEGRENHHITGAEIAEKKLREFNYPEEKIQKVKLCILNHRGSRENENKRDFIEAKIVAEADCLSAFECMAGLFETALIQENKNRWEAKNSVRKKLQNKWNQLFLEESKQLIKPKFEAAMLLLEDRK